MRKFLKAALGMTEPAPPPAGPSSTQLVPVPVIRPQRAEFDRPRDMAGYLERSGDSARPLVGATPMLRTADMEIRRAWGPTTAHARHLLTQSGFLSYGVELSCAWTAGGDGLQPNVTPDTDALRWNDAFARTWANAVEQRFREWSHDPRACDAQGRMKFGAMQNAAIRSYLATGDVLGVLDYSEKAGTSWRTSISLIDPTRLWTPNIYTTPGLRILDGVEHDEHGRALAYHIRPLPSFSMSTRFPVFNSAGKQLLLHAFDSEVGAVRGISPLAAAIQGVLQSQNVGDAAVLAAHVAAMVVGTITSDLPTDNVAKALGGADALSMGQIMAQRTLWHEELKKGNANLTLGHGARIAHLMSGEKFEMFAGRVSFNEYERIIRLGLAEAARALGLAPEHLTGLKDQATYSSLKVATAEARAIVDRRRKVLLEPLCEFALSSVVEEMISDGRLPWPGVHPKNALEDFRRKKQWALKTEWTGPAIEDPDVLKAVRAAVERVDAGLSSLSDEIAATGKDPETVMRQRAHDEAMLEELKVALPWTSKSQRINSSKGKKA